MQSPFTKFKKEVWLCRLARQYMRCGEEINKIELQDARRWKFNYSWKGFSNSSDSFLIRRWLTSGRASGHTKNLFQHPRTDSCLMVTRPLVVELILVKCHRRLVVYHGANVQSELSVEDNWCFQVHGGDARYKIQTDENRKLSKENNRKLSKMDMQNGVNWFDCDLGHKSGKMLYEGRA